MSLDQILFIKRAGRFCLVLITFFIFQTIATNVSAAESDLDGTYLPTVNNVVFSITAQPDGKAVIGGNFTIVNGQTRNYITRLNADGSLDASFNALIAPNSPVNVILRQADGKFLVGGQFTVVNGAAKNRIVRLNSDGSLDNTFDSSVGANNQIISLAVQANGQILVGGDFTAYNGVTRTYLARLNTNGSLDTTFNPTISSITSAGTLRVIVPQSDGTIYIGGGFDRVNFVTRQLIARLNADGSLDTSFNPGNGANSFVETILPLGGQILVGGSFNSFNNQTRSGLVLLNANGSVDLSYNPPLTAGSTVYNLVRQITGKILVSGSILGINGVNRRGIVRINADGSSDAAFNVNAGTNGTVNSTAVQPDGKILIGGQYLSYNGVNQARMARLNGMPPTVAGVTISGQVLGGETGLSNARIELTGSGGAAAATTITNPFGYFRFENVEAGSTYIINVSSKRFIFAPQVVSVNEDIAGLIFTGQP